MALVIKRKPSESVIAFVNRANRIIIKSGVLLEARKRKYYLKPPNERAKKESALHRVKVINEMARKRKLGLL